MNTIDNPYTGDDVKAIPGRFKAMTRISLICTNTRANANIKSNFSNHISLR